MTLESSFARVHREQLRDDKFVTKTATCTLKPHELFVNIDSTAGSMTVTLAPVAEMRGKFVTLYVTVYSGAITIAAGDSVDFTAPTFNGVDDGCVFYSDGVHWWNLGTRT